MGGSRGQVSIATRSGGGLEYSLRRGKDSHPGYAEACRFTTFRHVPPALVAAPGGLYGKRWQQ